MQMTRISGFFHYLIKRKGPHSIHSPFVFDFATKVIYDHKHHDAFDRILKARKSLLKNHNVIETVDFGASAGNKAFVTYRIAVNKLAKKRMNPIKVCKLLFNTTRYFKPETILEFGTSTGISTIALATARPDSQLITIEGCASVASVAENLFNKMELKNIEIVIGNFDNVLAQTLERIEKLDLVFFDGNHHKLPTIDYFNQCLTKAHENTVFIFDDIHWSDEMEEAWETIISQPNVSLSIDLFKLGFVFFRKNVEKQHFILKY